MKNNDSHEREILKTATRISDSQIWSKNQNHIPGLLSILVHVIAVTVMIVLSVVSYNKPKIVANDVELSGAIALSLPPALVRPGGGGGGTKAPTPASRGVLPKASDKQFVPPTPNITKMAPELAAEPTIIAPELANLLRVTDLVHMGDPKGVIGPPSGGQGKGSGIGDGDGHGDGPGDGPGVGPGKNGGEGGTDNNVVHIGAGGASNPNCPVPTAQPSYTDEARRAHVQGTVTLDVIVNRDGSVSVSKIEQRIGYGLDDEASQFVAKSFRCMPGIYQGKPVATPVRIDVNFHLY